MIKSILMKNCATYDAAGTSLADCKKVNYVFGANGSGKTTISSYLNNPTSATYAQSEVIWDSMHHARILVYNRAFRETHFFRNNTLPGVFTLGENAPEIQAELARLKENRAKRQRESEETKRILDEHKTKLNQAEDLFREYVWIHILKQFENQFQPAFEGVRNNKVRFLERVWQEYEHLPQDIAAYEDLQERAETLYGTKPVTCQRITLPWNQQMMQIIGEVEKSDIWSTAVVGNSDIPIAKLIQTMGSSDWVDQGRKFVKTPGKCPFCQQETITAELMTQLNDFFSGEYDAAIMKIAQYHDKYCLYTKSIIENIELLLSQTELLRVGRVDADALSSDLQLLKSVFSNNILLICSKQREPSRHFSLSDSLEIVLRIEDAVSCANGHIQKHNEMAEDFVKQKETLNQAVWAYCLNQEKKVINDHLEKRKSQKKAIDGISNKLKRLCDEIKRLENEIVDLNAKVISVAPTVDRINKLLINFGFDNFIIAQSSEQKNEYQLRRPDGSMAAHTLSEGEETFISFLYFMQQLEGATDENMIGDKRILVIDDPICSLDSNVMYIVSTLIKRQVQQTLKGVSDVEQIFIFTHNVFFHRELTHTGIRNSENKDTGYWIIRKDGGFSSIISYGNENPISSTYELLWKELKTKELAPVVLQNVLRRIVEQYFHITGGAQIATFDSPEEQIICESLLHWYNDGSHVIQDDMFVSGYEPSTAQYLKVFRLLFEKSGHIAHYNMMMGIQE